VRWLSEEGEKITVSVIKADVGGFPGHSEAHPDLLEACEGVLEEAKDEILIDYYVTRCGDDIDLIMTHTRGVDDEKVHELAWNAFQEATEVAKDLKLYGAGQDLLSDAFSGNVRGLGPGAAEMELLERPSEPIVVFCCDKTEPSAFNLPLFRIFADPNNTAGLVLDPSMHDGFEFEVHDVIDQKKVILRCPEEMYDLLALIGQTQRYAIKRVYKKGDGPEEERIAAVTSTERLNLIAGEYVGKDDPVAIVRCQSGFPALGEVLEPFALPHLVAGWMRGSHNGPLMPVSEDDAHPTRFDGPPRIMALGFQLRNGELIGPQDLFDDPAFDRARRLANEIADYIRSHGPFQPHLLSEEELEYTTLPDVLKKLEDRFEDLED